MKEQLHIENFGGIENLDIEINKINILIGSQATGKSIVAKLLYFFKSIHEKLFYIIEQELSLEDFNENLYENFIKYFPERTFPANNFYIKYEINEYFIELKKIKNGKLEFTYSNEYMKIFNSFKNKLKELKEQGISYERGQTIFRKPIEILLQKYYSYLNNKIGGFAGSSQLFIPAGRSFLAYLQKNVFSLIQVKSSFDPVIIDFGSFYEAIKDNYQNDFKQKHDSSKIDVMIENILVGKYREENGNDYIIHPDGRKIDLAFSSSGQQETLPLLLTLFTLPKMKFSPNGITIYIEEPEAHIFPEAQKQIVELIAYVFNISKTAFQFVITTHSPYILTSFNNLMEAGIIENESDEKIQKELHRIINKDCILKPDVVSAFSLHQGGINNIIDPETCLINAEIIDAVSNDLSIEFDKLLELI